MVRVVILGGGFGGLYTALGLQDSLGHRRDIEVTLINSDNYFLFYPLLPEAGLGDVEPDHTIIPLRALCEHIRFVRSEVTAVDAANRQVLTASSGDTCAFPYDHLVIALGSVPELRYIAGASDSALTFQSLADAVYLRNHVIDCFEQADIEGDPVRQAALLTFVVVGGGFTGVEVMGELEAFTGSIAEYYPRVAPEHIGLYLIHLREHLIPELDPQLSAYALTALQGRGVNVLLNMPVDRIDATGVQLPGGRHVASQTVIVATGITPAPLVATLPWAKDRKGRLLVRPDLQVEHAPGVWALGDCAAVPDPSGGYYPATAQHALREADVLAGNLVASLESRPTRPFRYASKGTMVNLGRRQGVAMVFNRRLQGFPAWLLWRAYYLARIPRWDRKLRILLDWLVRLIAPQDLAVLPVERPPHQRAATPAQPVARTDRAA